MSFFRAEKKGLGRGGVTNNDTGDDVTKGEWYKKVMSGRTDVRLTCRGIGTDGALQVAAALQNPQCAVQTLSLDGNNIGAGGATAMADAVRDNTTLQTLYLSSNNIGDLSLIHI